MQSPFEGQDRFLLKNLRGLGSEERAVAVVVIVADTAVEAVSAASGDAAAAETSANVDGTSSAVNIAAGTA